jgi:hypothetical protein
MTSRKDDTLMRHKIVRALITGHGSVSLNSIIKKYNVRSDKVKHINENMEEIIDGERRCKEEIDILLFLILDSVGDTSFEDDKFTYKHILFGQIIGKIADLMYESMNTRDGVMMAFRNESKRLIKENIESDHMNYDDIWSKFYANETERRDNSNWMAYSVILPIESGMRFIVYNCSHLLHSGDVVHRSTRVQLIIPANVLVGIIFHGRLVHAGAAQENDKMDYRWFNYVEKKNRNTTIDRRKVSGKIMTTPCTLCPSDCKKCAGVNEEGKFDINISDLMVTEGNGIYNGLYDGREL